LRVAGLIDGDGTDEPWWQVGMMMKHITTSWTNMERWVFHPRRILYTGSFNMERHYRHVQTICRAVFDIFL